jgi:hypothetical protein
VAVGESETAIAGAAADECGLAVGDGCGVAVVVGSGVGESVGHGVFDGAGDGGSVGESTVPIMGLSRSSANERGVTIKRQRRTRAMIAFFIVDSGVLATMARVMKLALTIIFSRVLPEQFKVEGQTL